MVTEADIANIVSQWTGIPVEKVSSDESERLVKMEEVLHKRVIGQEEAIVAISRAIRRARVGLKNPNRPIASFIFAGPTGVGKSELAKTLASFYFGSEEAMVSGATLAMRWAAARPAGLGPTRGLGAAGGICGIVTTLRPFDTTLPTLLSPARCASTCPSSWSDTRCPSSSGRPPATWATRRVAS